MPQVTVIIPIHNVAPYLPAALDSLIAQSFTDWEALCVDDGSTDGCPGILDAYGAKDSRLRIIHQANAGVSAARNVGLDRAAGRIVTFLDADDTVEPEWLTRLVTGIADVAWVWGGAAIAEVNHGGRLTNSLPCDIGACYTGAAVQHRAWRAVFGYRLRDLTWLLFPGGMWRWCRREFGSVCWRAFRRDVIGELRFDPHLSLGEDALFVAAYALRAQSMRIIGDTGYRYAIRATGSMLTGTRERLAEQKFRLRDARRSLDPRLLWWKGSYLLSALQLLKSTRSFTTVLRYLRFKPF